eukprot:5696240-Pyramimonas_sp.AAC.1
MELPPHRDRPAFPQAATNCRGAPCQRQANHLHYRLQSGRRGRSSHLPDHPVQQMARLGFHGQSQQGERCDRARHHQRGHPRGRKDVWHCHRSSLA